MNMDQTKAQFELPLKLRRFENLHIIFWLLKDMAWSMGWRLKGISMIIPTLLISIYMTRKFKGNPSEWYHNLAVICWIVANSYWMISEFFGFEELFIFGWVKWVHLALIPFVSGLLFIAFYYIFVRKSVMDD
jgi:hypothetical protein